MSELKTQTTPTGAAAYSRIRDTELPRKFRIAVLNTHPIQYFAPLYAFLNTSPDLEVTALYLSDFSLRGGHDEGFGQPIRWDVELLQGYPYKFLGNDSQKRGPDGGFFSFPSSNVWKAVRDGGYDALWLHGHGYASHIVALAAARSIGMPVLMRGETHLRLARRAFRKTLRTRALRTLYGNCQRFLAIGTANLEFYRSLGVPASQIFLMPYAVDNSRFISDSQLAPAERQQARVELGVEDELPLILFAAKFQPHKRPHDVVQACARLHSEGLQFHLVLAGSGEMDAQLRQKAREFGLPRVHFPGFVNQTSMPRLYGAADLFVLPSAEEPWGLVVNEAMCAGLPIVATTAVGSVPDLVRNGENGAAYQAGDADALAAALRPIICDQALRKSMSARSLELIQAWGYDACRDGLRAAVSGLKPNH